MSMPAGFETEGTMTLVVSPLIAVLAMAIGCSILDDAAGPEGAEEYEPLYMACRMGALGGPVAALFCVLVSSSFVLEADEEPGGDPAEIVRIQRTLASIRSCWGAATPYLIGVGGGPIGSAIMRAAHLANTIRPLAAVRAAAVGGIFATPIYFIFAYLAVCIMRPCCIDDVDENLNAVV